MNSTDMMKAAFKNDKELFLSVLGSIAIVDIGTIVEVRKDGRALVRGSSFIGGKQVEYQDAEIVFPGNSSGAFSVQCAGTPCLIFIPCSCMPSIEDKNVRLSAPVFNKDGVKVMPIGNAANDVVKTQINNMGLLNIMTHIYNVFFEEDCVSISKADDTSSACMDSNGDFHISRRGSDGTYNKDVLGDQVTETWASKDKDVFWTDTYLSDGSRSFVQTDAEENVLFSLTVDADGTASVNLSKGLTLESEDALVLKGKSVSIESTDTTVDIVSKTDTTINTGSGNKLSVNDDNLEVLNE